MTPYRPTRRDIFECALMALVTAVVCFANALGAYDV